MNNAIDLPSVQEADHVVRVSVLDLDNAVRFSWQTDGRSRKQSRHMLALGPKTSGTKLRCTAYARAPNSVDLYLSIRCQCHVLPPCGDLRTLRPIGRLNAQKRLAVKSCNGGA